MHDAGACTKQTIKDTIGYNPNDIISNTEELMTEVSNICISTYNVKMMSIPAESYFQTWVIWKLLSQGNLEYSKYMRFLSWKKIMEFYGISSSMLKLR